MAGVRAERLTADAGGEFVVFLIGMRVNKPWKLHMPPFGLARATRTVPATGRRESAPGRMNGASD